MINPNLVDKSKSDAKNPTGACPLMKQKVQLLPLRYGLVERLDPKAELSLPYKTQSQPLGIRLLRDGWLYVIDNSTGYLHEYQVESGLVSKKLWQGQEAVQDKREGSVGENALIFPRGSTLHISYSEVQWTAAKCSRMLASRKERDYFMQAVDLSKATCDKGGKHLLSTTQAQKWIAEVAEQPAETSLPGGANPEEIQDYIWEDQTLYAKTSLGAVKRQLQATYEHDHLYLVFKDSIGVMRDLAQAQDTVVEWIQKWVEQERNDLRYMVGNYIETLMIINDSTASGVASSTLFEKTTPAQRQSIYDYINARNTLNGMSGSSPETAYYPGRGYDAKTSAARAEVDAKKAAMNASLGDELYAELEDDIDALKDSSDATLQGSGLGARGIHDLVRHEEMRQYLEGERVHLKRWNTRLDLITEDRVGLFTQEEYHRSAWYFDADVPDQLLAALTAEQNCVRDMCRTEESVKEVGEFFHEYPYYILPAFASRVDLNTKLSKAVDLIKWLDEGNSLSDSLQDAQARDIQLNTLLGNHWAGNPDLSPNTQAVSQAVLAAYSPAIALRMQDWLAELQAKLDSPELKGYLDKLKTLSNRAQRLGALAQLKQHGATLQVATEQDVSLFKANLLKLTHLIEAEDELTNDRNQAQRDSKRRMLGEAQRKQAKYRKSLLNNQLLVIRQDIRVQSNLLADSITTTSTLSAGSIGVKLKLEPAQQSQLNEEIRRLRLGAKGGYGESGWMGSAVKSSALPLVALYFQVSNLGEAWAAWDSAKGHRKLKDVMLLVGANFAPVASALSVYQNAHISLVDGALKAIATSSNNQGGMQFAAKLGKLGLGLGVAISPLALTGSLATSWQNWNKWTDALRTGTTGEQAGALLALAGDSSSTAVNAAITGKAFAEFGGLIVEVATAKSGNRAVVTSRAWATRGTRFLSFSARLSPWGLAAAALQFGGEALYNYNHLDEQQQWLEQCCWGLGAQGWDWPTHAQGLAEATLQPTLQDKGLIQRKSDGEQIRRLLLTLPGICLASLRQQPFSLAAQYLSDSRKREDVSQQVATSMRTVSDSPLILALDIPAGWSGLQSQLLLRLAVQPALAQTPLKRAQGGLYYAIPLSSTAMASSIKASTAPEAGPASPQWVAITREHLNATK